MAEGKFLGITRPLVEDNNSTFEFTVDVDSVEVTLRDATVQDQAREEVLAIVSPRFSSQIETSTTQIGDVRAVVDVSGAGLGDIKWLENQIDEAEEEGLEIYDVRVEI